MDDTDRDAHPLRSIDRWMIGAGVALLAVPATFAILVARPSRLAPFLDGNGNENGIPGRARHALGPGLFFILALLSTVAVAKLFMEPAGTGGADAAASESVVTDASALRDASYATGASAARLVNGLIERLDAGNLWSAVMIAIPVFVFALVLALINRMLVLGIAPRWSASHAVGSSLYMVGSLIVWLIIAVMTNIVLSQLGFSFIGSLAAFLLVVTGLAWTGVQAYAFWESHGALTGVRLGLAATAIPIAILTLIVTLLAI